jgi:hypothetical protein
MIISDKSIKKIASTLTWGTYGLPPKLPVKWIKLEDCTTDHLQNIFRTQYPFIDNTYRTAIVYLLKERKAEVPTPNDLQTCKQEAIDLFLKLHC